MAYNNGFPIGYQPYYQQATYQAQMPSASYSSQQHNAGIIWVQGEAGAKSYLVAPNTTVQLWDSENQVIYLKSADASGMPSMKVLDYTIRSEAPTAPSTAFQQSANIEISKADLDALQRQIDDLREQIHAQVRTAPMKEGDADGKSIV